MTAKRWPDELEDPKGLPCWLADLWYRAYRRKQREDSLAAHPPDCQRAACMASQPSGYQAPEQCTCPSWGNTCRKGTS